MIQRKDGDVLLVYIYNYVIYTLALSRIYRMTTHQNLSSNFLQNLYLNNPASSSQPILQILGFEGSENHPKEIIIRLSDGSTFFDATLVGPYELGNGKILVSPFTNYHGTMEFKKLDVVRIADYFSKIDPAKICRLKVMIRKIVEVRTCDQKIGRPQELAFYMQFNRLVPDHDPLDSHPCPQPPEQRTPHVEVKICEEDQPARERTGAGRAQEKKVVTINKELQFLGICKDRNPDEPLTVREIMNGYEGFFIGRLVRLKQTQKEGKEGSIPMLALGFLDSCGEMLRLNLLGKMAVREEKELRRGRCFYLKGLEVVQTKGSSYVKLREKDYKLHVIAEQSITTRYAEEYFHWEHEHDYIENENVDVVGVVEDIEEKTVYGSKPLGDGRETKEVIRVVIRNKFKIVKVSFWSDQLKNLLKYNLKKGEVVLVEDVKKKKIVFLDYSTESTLSKLDPSSELYSQLQHLLPERIDYPEPINVQSLYQIQRIDRFSTKVHTVNAYLSKIHDDKLLFKYCDLCKKKINLHSAKCFDCKGNVISIKYNTNVEFADYSGSVFLAVFDNVAEKLFGISALALKEMRENLEEYDKFLDAITYMPFAIGVEIKSQRFILRSVEALKGNDIASWCRESLKVIEKLGDRCE